MALSIKQGDTLTIDGTRTDSDGDPVNLAGYTITSQLRNVTLVHDLTCDLVVAASGTFRLSATAAETALWARGSYDHDIQFEAPDGSIASTATGAFVVVEDVTR